MPGVIPFSEVVNIPEDVPLPWIFLYHKVTEQIAVFPFDLEEEDEMTFKVLLVWAQLATLEMEVQSIKKKTEDLKTSEPQNVETEIEVKTLDELIVVLTSEADKYANELESLIQKQD